MARLGSDVEVIFSAVDEFSAPLNKFRSEMGRAASEAERHWTAVQGAWLKVAGAIAAAAYVAKQAWDVAEVAARFEEQKIALDGLAKQYGISSAAMIASIQRAAEGTIAQVDAIGVANKALVMGLNPQQLEFFTMAAKRLSGAIGGDTAQAFERLTEAVATGQQRQLKQLGIIVDLEAEYKKYSHELSIAEKQTANFEAVSRALNTTLAQMGPDIDTAADKMERLGAKMKDLKKDLGNIVLQAAGAAYGIFYPAGLEAAFAQAEADSKNLYKNLDELNKKAKELAAEGLFIAVAEEDIYRTRDWLTINLSYMEHLEKAAERFREQLLKTPIDIYWLPSDEEIDRKTKAMEAARQRFYNRGATNPDIQMAGGLPSEVAQLAEMYDNLYTARANYTKDIVAINEAHVLGVISAKEAEMEITSTMNQAMYTQEKQTHQLRLQSYVAMASMMNNTMQALFVATGSKNKALFEAYKTFAVANAMINAYLAASNVLANESKFGATAAYTMAAMIYAQGLAQAYAIASQQMSGSVGAASYTSGGGSISTGSPSTATSPALTGGQQRGNTTYVYYINAIDTQTFSEYVKKNGGVITGLVAQDIKTRGEVSYAIKGNA